MTETGIKPQFSVKKAHEAQLRLSKHIIFHDDLPQKIRFVGGVDVAYANDVSISAVAVLDFDSLRLVESQIASCKTCFPYVPTLLSFREIMPTVLCIRKLHVQPDLFLADGHGFAHPYRCGFASHLGLVIGKPTIGVAKERLVGQVAHVEGDTALISDNGEVIGAAVTTKQDRKPVYVSVGHMVSLETAIKIVKHCASVSRIPEPISKAHEIATAEKRKINILSATKTSNK
jgi:deoxyribonuclease V